uniref:RNA-dependent RNA polymerase n=1 Tax=Botryosphaeria dothidea narnavirus 2 TaxID=2785366 RepID=A0A7T4X3Z6_9VIRU|nr:RNA-dependent RNA polymerase [Botryosphaeria dothidea narnavirus 2]
MMLLALHYATSSRVTPGSLSAAKLCTFLRFIARRLSAMQSMGSANRMIRTLKGACHQCRAAGLTGVGSARSAIGQVTPFQRPVVSREYLLQLSMGARALPPAPKFLLEQGVAKQLHVLTTPCEPPAWSMAASVGRFVRTKCRRFRCEDSPLQPNFTSTSASYAYSRREGGRAGELKELLQCAGFEGSLKSRPPGTVTQRIQDYLRLMGEFLSDEEYEMESRSVAISEYGYKARVVSCSDPVRIHQSESYRRQLIKLLGQLRPSALPLRQDLDVLRLNNSDPCTFVYSADLTQATDYLDHHVITAFCDALGVPFELVTGGTIDDCAIARGTLMGIPCSWPILSLVHMWACWAMEIPWRSFLIKGDDLIGLWTMDEIHRYQTGIQLLTGMPPNLDKSFVSKDRGLFCERVFARNGSVLNLVTQVIPVRFLVVRTPSEEGFPYPLKTRKVLWTLVGRFHYAKLFRMGTHWTGVSPRLSGLSYLPVEYGGLECLPHSFCEAAPTLVARIASAVHDSTAVRKTLHMLRMSWSRAYPLESAEKLFSDRYSVVELGLCLSKDGGIPPSLEEQMVIDRELFSAWAHFIREPTRRVGYHRYYHVVRRLKRRLEKKALPQHGRLNRWTIQGVRRLLQSLDFALFPSSQLGSAAAWEIQISCREILDRSGTGRAFTD